MYPKKIKKYEQPAGPIGSDSFNITGDTSKMSSIYDKPKSKINPLAVAQGVSTLGTIGLSTYQSKNPTQLNDLGIGTQNTNEASIQGGLTGMNAGMSLGSVAGPVGAGIGAGVGLIGGIVKAQIDNAKEIKSNRNLTASLRKDQRSYLDQEFKQNTNLINEQARQQRALIPSNYRMFSASKGGLFPKFQKGGVTPHAVIPSGPLHSEKNNLGTKGLPVVHSETNEKKAEVEREEIIFTKPQTDFIMKYHNELKSNPSDQDYEEFGKLVGIFIDGAKDMNNE